MNGDHQLLAAAPLDLRTTHRDHGTLNCKGGVRDAPPPAESRRRSADKPSSRLPFRKRPIHLEPETEAPAAGAQPARQRLSPAEQSPCPPSVAGRSAAANRGFPTSVLPLRNEARCWKPPEFVTPLSYGRRVHRQGHLNKSLFLHFFLMIWSKVPSDV